MLDGKTRALLGDHEAAQRLTDAGGAVAVPVLQRNSNNKSPESRVWTERDDYSLQQMWSIFVQP